MTLAQVPAATLFVALGLCGTLRAQAPAQPSAGSVSVASGASEHHTVARLVNGRLVAAAPCVAAEGPLDAARDWRVAATGPHQLMEPRHIRVGSEDWNRVAPRLQALGTKGELRWEEDGRPRGPTVPDLRPLGIVLTASDQVWVMEGRTPRPRR